VELRLGRTRRIGVLAIDPTSPVSRGSVLGDRIRMEGVSGHPALYIRSVPERWAGDGLCDNIADLLLAMDSFAFDDLIVETVGVGQAGIAVRNVVDTVVLVLMPGSGDTVQAMKAGIIETADVIVANKADLPGASRVRTELNTVVRRGKADGAWTPPVVLVSATEARGIDALDAAIEQHGAWRRTHCDPVAAARERRKYHAQSLIARRVRELLDGGSPARFDDSLAEVYRALLRELAAAP
jgi:LAO/AO transport system kinase